MTFIDIDFGSNTNSDCEEIPNVPKKFSIKMEQLKLDVYILVEHIYLYNIININIFY